MRRRRAAQVPTLATLATLAVLALAACAATPAPAHAPVAPAPAPAPARPPMPAAPPAAAPDLAYTFRFVPGPAPTIDVEVVAAADPSGATTFSLEDGFADVSDPQASIRDVRARALDGGALAVEAVPPRSWRVRAPAGTRIALAYQMFSTHPAGEGDRFRTIVTPHLVHFIGHLALIAPDDLAEGTHAIRFAWAGLDAAGLHPATSFGAHATETVHESLDAFRASVFLAAGDLRLTTRRVGGGELEVATVGGWKFSDAQLADKIAAIVAMERAFFADAGPPYFFVSAWPLGAGLDYGGTGYTHSFDLAMSPEVTLDDDIVGMLAHEHFHMWNGEKITPEAFETLTYWFTEGFTDFYAARLRYRAGMLSLAGYVRELDQAVRDYETSPVRDLPNARIAGGFWTDHAVEKVPYYRGDVVALVTDREIRRATGGGASLDDVMRTLAGARDPQITSERVLAMIEGLTSTAFAARLRATVIDGAPLEIPLDLFAPCLSGSLETTWQYDLGFDFPASQKAHAIVGVRPGSAAAKAGVRDGLRLRGVSIYWGQIDKPVELDLGTPAHHVAYLPHGRAVRVPHFAVADASRCADVLGPPIAVPSGPGGSAN